MSNRHNEEAAGARQARSQTLEANARLFAVARETAAELDRLKSELQKQDDVVENLLTESTLADTIRDKLRETVTELVETGSALCEAWVSTDDAIGGGTFDSYAPNGWSDYHNLRAAIERANKGE